MEWYLPVIWAALIGVAVALYVILDGFDLGIGIRYIHRLIERGPEPALVAPPAGAQGLPNRPLSLGRAAAEPHR